MKLIKIILLAVNMLFAVSCMDMYNEIDNALKGYNYYLVSTDRSSGYTRIYSVEAGGIIDYTSAVQYTTGSEPCYPAVHPNGKYLYVPDFDNDQILVYSISNGGIITLLQTLTGTPNQPYAVKLHPSGNYLYMVNYDNTAGHVTVYDVAADGKISVNSTFSTIFVSPRRIAVHPSGNFIYVVQGVSASANIAVLQVNADGSLTQLEYQSSAGGTNLTDIVIHPNGNYIYATRASGFDKYTINSDGKINDTADSGYATAYSSGIININSAGSMLFVATGTTFYSYSLDSSGVPALINSVASTQTGQVYDSVMHPNDDYVYFSNYGNDYIHSIKVGSDGTISIDSEYHKATFGLALFKIKK